MPETRAAPRPDRPDSHQPRLLAAPRGRGRHRDPLLHEESLEDSLSELERSTIFDQPDLASDKLALLAENNSISPDPGRDHLLRAPRARDRHPYRAAGDPLGGCASASTATCARSSPTRGNCTGPSSPGSRSSATSTSPSRASPRTAASSMPIGNADRQLPLLHDPLAVRREGGDPHPRDLTGKKTMLTLDKMMMSQNDPAALQAPDPKPQRHHLRHRADRLRQDDHALLRAARDQHARAVNISTIEDPSKSSWPASRQSQVNAHDRPEVRHPPARAHAAGPRRDPDRRDPRLETAKIATEAALTGHIVFATLHTNTAAPGHRPPDRDRGRALHGRPVGHRRPRPAAGGAHLRQLQGGLHPTRETLAMSRAPSTTNRHRRSRFGGRLAGAGGRRHPDTRGAGGVLEQLQRSVPAG
jgi:hypothetical protein